MKERVTKVSLGLRFKQTNIFCRVSAVLLLTLLVLGGLPVQTVKAAAAAETACDALGYEQLTDEVYYAVTKKLTLPSELDGASITWESDSAAINASTGAVTRDKYSDKAVTLTAHISSGNSEQTKSFPFVVLSEQAEIYMSEDFAYDTAEKRITTVSGVSVNSGSNAESLSGKGWAFAKGTTLSKAPTGGMDAVLSQSAGTEKAQNNHALKLWREGAGDSVPHYLRYDLEQKAADQFVWEADIKSVNASFPQVYIFELYGAYSKNEKKTRVRLAEFNLRFDANGKGKFGVYYWNEAGSEIKSDLYSCSALEQGSWNRVKLVLDTEKQAWDAYVDDVQINTEAIPFFQRYKKGADSGEPAYLNDFQISTYRGYTGGTLYVDNISVRRATDDYSANAEAYQALEAVTESAILGANASRTEITGDLTIPPVSGGSVTFISSDESAIDSQGRYVNTSSEDKAVTLTAVVTKNGQTAKKSFSLVALAAEKYRKTNAVYNLLSFECFTNEPQNAVTKNLNLSRENLGAICDLEGVNVSFFSTNPDVLDAETGAVSRQSDDVPLQLTMTVASGDYSKEKTMDVVVPAGNKEVYYSSNFRLPEQLGQNVSELDKWADSSTDTSRVTKLESVDNNYVLRSYRETADTQDMSFVVLQLHQACTTAFTTEMQMKFMQDKESAAAAAPIYVLEVRGVYSIGDKAVTAKVAELRFGYDSQSITFNYMDGSTINYIDIETLPELDTWFDIKLDFDVLEHGFDLYIDGKKLNSDKLPFYQKYVEGYNAESFKLFGGIYYTPMRVVDGLSMLVDDVAVTGLAGLHHLCRFYENGKELQSVRYLKDYSRNSKIDIEVLCGNDAGEAKTFDLYMALYEKERLLSVQKSKEPLTLADGGSCAFTFENINLPCGIEDLTIKCFAWTPEGLQPINKETEISGCRTFGYTPQKFDGGAGRDITYVDLNGEKAYKVYFNAQSWSGDSQKLYFHTADPENYIYTSGDSREYDRLYSIYAYNRETDEIRFISKCNYFYNLVTVGDYLIFADEDNQIVRVNTVTDLKEVIAPLSDYVTGQAELLTVTNDGRYLAAVFSGDSQSMGTEDKHYRRFPVLDMETGEWNDSCFYGFDDVPPYNTCINPAYPSLLLFNHANDANDERIWVMNTETGIAENIYVQKPYDQTHSGEGVSHECWTYDGERLVLAVDDIGDRQLGSYGIVSINKEGRDRRVVNDDYGYLHLGASPISDRWVVADTGYGSGISSKIVLIDLYSGESHLLAEVNQSGADSVAHCHPAFTPDGRTVYFGMYNADYSSNGIGFIDVSDIIESAPAWEAVPLSENCRTERVGNQLPSTDGGYKLTAGEQMNVNYLGEEKENTAATITIEYYADEGAAITLEYYRWTKYTDTSASSLEQKTEAVSTEAGGWKTAQIPLSDMNLEGYGLLGGDFAVKAAGGNVIIRSVRLD